MAISHIDIIIKYANKPMNKTIGKRGRDCPTRHESVQDSGGVCDGVRGCVSSYGTRGAGCQAARRVVTEVTQDDTSLSPK